jgi:cobalt-zinc-cadmium efflux system outer membrane protein
MVFLRTLITGFVVCLPITLSGASWAESTDWSRLSLEQAITRALERNPAVVESRLEWRRMQGAAEGVAGVLVENPLVSAEGGVRRDQGWVGNQPSIAGRIDQPLDVFGQAGSRKRAASDLVVAASARLALVRSEIGARVRLLYLSAQVAKARIMLCQERLSTAKQTSEALQMRVRLGASSDIDLHMAMAETARAEAALQEAQSAALAALLLLREGLDLPAQAKIEPSDPLVPPAALPAGMADPRSVLVHHVAMQAVEKRRFALDSEIVRLERERLPRLSVGIAAERPSDQERFVGLALSVSPALWRRNQGPLAEARVERERLDFEQATTLASLERRWTALRDEQAARLRELSARDKALESEEQTRALVRVGWQSGKFDFLRVLLAERSVADTKQARLDLSAVLESNAIELRRLTGQEP